MSSWASVKAALEPFCNPSSGTLWVRKIFMSSLKSRDVCCCKPSARWEEEAFWFLPFLDVMLKTCCEGFLHLACNFPTSLPSRVTCSHAGASDIANSYLCLIQPSWLSIPAPFHSTREEGWSESCQRFFSAPCHSYGREIVMEGAVHKMVWLFYAVLWLSGSELSLEKRRKLGPLPLHLSILD